MEKMMNLIIIMILPKISHSKITNALIQNSQCFFPDTQVANTILQ